MMINKEKFIQEDNGWSMSDSHKFFLGKQVEITIDTKTDPDHPDKDIFEEQMETLKIIDANWDELSKTIEQEILNYDGISKKDLLEILDSPRIWLGLDYDTNQPWKDNHWSFVLGVTVSEDFGWHVEFDGAKHKETWAGG